MAIILAPLPILLQPALAYNNLPRTHQLEHRQYLRGAYI